MAAVFVARGHSLVDYAIAPRAEAMINPVWWFGALLLVAPVWADNAVKPADPLIQPAYSQKQTDLVIEGEGQVIKLLPDDNHGSRHQRFIIRLPSGQTLLVAHNIDLASKIDPLSVGDVIDFRGEYEWNAKGGTVHWTHHDPAGRHIGGWLKHGGQTYQ